MRTEHHHWYSPRLGHDMGVAVFGHWGPPLLAFPTSHGDEWELQRHGLIDALGEFIDAGRVKIFCVGSNNHESFLNSGAHPFHRSWRQRMFDEYIREEVIPFIYHRLPVAGTSRSRRWARRSARITPPTRCSAIRTCVKRCYALSGVYDLRRFMDGLYDDNFYFHNPVDYVANLERPVDPRAARELRDPPGDRIGPVGGEPLHLRVVGASWRGRGSATHLDDWGPRGGHDWPYWKDQMREYLRGGNSCRSTGSCRSAAVDGSAPPQRQLELLEQILPRRRSPGRRRSRRRSRG